MRPCKNIKAGVDSTPAFSVFIDIMAGLHKPISCRNCGSISLHREYRPERWVCNECGDTVVSRDPPKKIPELCVTCKKVPPYGKGSNRCRECRSNYNREYREKNHEKLREQHRASYQRDKKKRQAAIRAAVQRSPEGFITHLLLRLRKPSSRKRKYVNPVTLVCEIDRDYVIGLYYGQSGKCALSGVQMEHKLNDLRSISIDRIDTSDGYVKGNVQLVCKFVNLGKSKHSNEEVISFFNAHRTSL